MLLQESPRKDKRFRLTFDDSSYVDFGAKDGITFIDGRSEKERQAWIARHKNDKGYDNPKSGIYYSRMLLWEEPTLKKAIRKLEKKIKNKIDVI